MAKKIIIIGAVALGPKVACRLRRLEPEAEITLIDRDNLVSYGGCGIPYYIGGDVNDIEDLRSTSAHVIRDTKFFEETKGVHLLTRTEAVAIDRKEKVVTVVNLDSNEESKLPYDKLVLATGASPVVPPLPGCDLPGVFTIANLHEAEKIKTLMSRGKVGTAVIVGAGAIGIELCEAMTDLWGIQSHLIEMENRVLPTLLSEDIATVAKTHLLGKGVEMHLGDRVEKIEKSEENGQLVVNTAAGVTIATDIVILATGVRPNTRIAEDCGISLGSFRGILTDARMRTNDPNIYAGGDCVEVRHLISGENVPMALGSLANRQGRVIADNIHGRKSFLKGGVGSFCIKIFDIGIAKAGLTIQQARQAGFEPVAVVTAQADRAHFYPEFDFIYITLIADKNSAQILGIEAVGNNGDAVKARVDAVAVLLQYGATVDDICTLEACYAPPYASAMDAINNAGNTLDNLLTGQNSGILPSSFLQKFNEGEICVVDVRSEKEAAVMQEKYGTRWLCHPLDSLRNATDLPDKEKELYLICDTGARSYEALNFLSSKGYNKIRNIQGGMAMLKMLDPSFFP